jgi:hypothetical protein
MPESKISTTVGIMKLKMLYKAALLLHYFNTQFIYRVYSGREALNLYKNTKMFVTLFRNPLLSHVVCHTINLSFLHRLLVFKNLHR